MTASWVKLSRWTLASMLLRSFAVQGSWNYRTLIGTGFTFALLPGLRAIYHGRPEELDAAVARHTALFNSHPYLVPVALGAVAVLEQTESAVVVERFKSAVRGSLGGLGDRLIWAGWRPVCLLAALLLLALGATWGLAVTGFLIVYNIGHVVLRITALRFGLHHGKQLGERLRSLPIERAQSMLQSSGAFLIGALLPLLASGRTFDTPLPLAWTGLAALAAIAGIRFGAAVRLPVVLCLAALALAGLLWKVVA